MLYIYHRHPVPESRPITPQIIIGLQRPDFIYCKWSTKETSLYNEASRTLGTPLENGQCLHKDLQRKYLLSSDENSTGNENNTNKIVHERELNHSDILLIEEGDKGRPEDGDTAKHQDSNNEVFSTDVQVFPVDNNNITNNEHGVNLITNPL